MPTRLIQFIAYSLLGIMIPAALAFHGHLAGDKAATTAPATTSDPASLLNAASPFLTNTHQITFQGLRSGEGYFSQDGKKMIFQSERMEANPFYQIYMMDLASGKTDLISTGQGQTTCSWVHPDGKKVLFSSTHLDPKASDKAKAEFESRKAPANKYSWNFDETYDIFEKNLKSGKLVNLTHSKGYDAEGSYSPDGKWIAFASNRIGYESGLTPEDQEHFKKDPSFMMDIYIMKADGTSVKRLTTLPGYDGGPFFSADGKKITFRHFTTDGRSAEIYTMNTDGSELSQLTHLNAMSWAPYFHPTGEYLIFTTNLQGFQNFELYIVDRLGRHEPVRVTFEDGFDGLPVFSPDGQKLSWTKRNTKGESQIYLANWDHDQALRALDIAPPKLAQEDLSPKIRAQDLKSIVYNLSSKKSQGRMTGSLEEKEMQQEIAALFAKWGLKSTQLSPGGQAKGFINEFEFLSDAKLTAQNEAHFELAVGDKIKTDTLKIGEDWNPLSFSQNGGLKGEVTFAGYGIKSPATDKFPEYDSYKNLNVKNKWVLIFRDIPNDLVGERRYHLNLFSRLQHKIVVAKNLGAKGVIFMTGPQSPMKQKLPKFRFEGGLSDSSLQLVYLDDGAAEKMLNTSAQRSLQDLQKTWDDGEFHEGFDLKGLQFSATTDIETIKSKGHSVLGEIYVPGAKSTLVIGAHGDHLGASSSVKGTSLATPQQLQKDPIHYGADDNASGVSAVLELANLYAEQNKKGIHPPVNLVFAVWSGEELGNLGSTQFLKQTRTSHSRAPNLAPISAYISAYINADMIGRLRDKLYVMGAGSSPYWKSLLEGWSQKTSVTLVSQDDPYLPTDAMSFYVEAQVPILSLFTGSHSDYHTPQDTPEKINFAGLEAITQLMKLMIDHSATDIQHLTYQKVQSSSQQKMEGRKFRVYLGTIPDYSQEGLKGVRISGTTQKSPAEKAGLQSQDVIVELGGQKIENIHEYSYMLEALKPSVEVTVKVLRSGKLEELKITPLIKE